MLRTHLSFSNHVLDITDGLHDMGGFQGNVVIALLVAWIIVYFVLIKGVETFGKVRDRLFEALIVLIAQEGII